MLNIEVAKICKELAKLTRDEQVIYKKMIKTQDAQMNIALEIEAVKAKKVAFDSVRAVLRQTVCDKREQRGCSSSPVSRNLGEAFAPGFVDPDVEAHHADGPNHVAPDDATAQATAETSDLEGEVGEEHV